MYTLSLRGDTLEQAVGVCVCVCRHVHVCVCMSECACVLTERPGGEQTSETKAEVVGRVQVRVYAVQGAQVSAGRGAGGLWWALIRERGPRPWGQRPLRVRACAQVEDGSGGTSRGLCVGTGVSWECAGTEEAGSRPALAQVIRKEHLLIGSLPPRSPGEPSSPGVTMH